MVSDCSGSPGLAPESYDPGTRRGAAAVQLLHLVRISCSFAELEPEREAAASALERLRGQAKATRNEATLREADVETLAALQAIRETLAGLATDAADLDAARRALRRAFESFTLHRCGDDAILSPLATERDDHDEPTTEQAQRTARVPVSS
jgi:hypothetical protein